MPTEDYFTIALTSPKPTGYTDNTSEIATKETCNNEMDGPDSGFLSRYFLIFKRVQNTKVALEPVQHQSLCELRYLDD